MQPITPDARLPRSTDRILLPHEQDPILVRYHPAVLASPIAAVLAALVVILALSGWLKFSTLTLLIIWLAWLFLLLRAIWKVANWRVSYYIVTEERVLFIKGVLARDVTMIPIAMITDIWYERSVMGRLIGYGRFILELAVTQERRRIDFLPYPEQLYLEVVATIFEDYAG
jgi:membrane protein YdbS with pleckstrin-like domain